MISYRVFRIIGVGAACLALLTSPAGALPEGPPGATTGDTASPLKGLALPVSAASNTGTATFRFPFELPAGRNGFQPDLALEYAHTRPNGPYGPGWDLDLPRIERILRLGVPDYSRDEYNAVTPNGSAELEKIGFVSYGARIDEHHFRTWFQGDNSWRLRDTSGTIYEFGTDPDARIGPDPSQKNETFAWYVTRITDRTGNTIEFSYENDSGYVYPSEIRYGGHTAGQQHVYQVSFHYSGLLGDKVQLSYAAGFRRATRLRVSDVEIRNITAQNQLISRYRIEWKSSPANGHSLIDSIRMFGSDNVSSLPPTSFEYSEGTSMPVPGAPGAVDRDDPLPPGFITTFSDWNVQNDRHCFILTVADINGDGLPDSIWSKGGATKTWTVQLNQGIDAPELYGPEITWEAPDECLTREHDLAKSWDVDKRRTNRALVDLDGDGVVEYVVSDSDDSDSDWFIYWAREDGRFELSATPWPAPSLGNRPRPIAYREFRVKASGSTTDTLFNVTRQIADLLDLNGDGRPEIALVDKEGGLVVYWNEGDGFDQEGETLILPGPKAAIRGGQGGADRGFISHIDYDIFDLNGDGLPERIQAVGIKDPEGWCEQQGKVGGQYWYVWYGTGRGFTAEPDCWEVGRARIRHWNEAADATWADYDAIDVNGDGLPDLVDDEFPIDSFMEVSFNTGRGFAPAHSVPTPAPLRLNGLYSGIFPVPYAETMDVDGNGRPDSVAPVDGLVYFGDVDAPPPNFLTQVTNPLGGSTRIEYASSPRRADLETVFDVTPERRTPFGGGPRWLVSRTIQHDPLSGDTANTTTAYRYGGAYFDSKRREFRGYQEVAETDDFGATLQTAYYQSEILASKPAERIQYARPYYLEPQTLVDGYLYREGYEYHCGTGTNCLDVDPSSASRHFPVLYATERVDYGSKQDDPWEVDSDKLTAETRTTRQYDACGNLTEELQAEYDWTSDEWQTLKTQRFAHASIGQGCNTSLRVCDGICDRIASEEVVGGLKKTFDHDAKGNSIRETRIGVGNPNIKRLFDGYGNLRVVKDARGTFTVTEYDVNHLHPVKEIDDVGGLEHITLATYDDRFGTMLSRTDPAGAKYEWRYDVFGRLQHVIEPGQSEDQPTRTYNYFIGAEPRIDTVRFEPNRGTDLTESIFLDGFGRILQKQERRMVAGSDQVVVTQGVKYGLGGRVVREYDTVISDDWVIRRFPLGGAHATLTYDQFGRVLRRQSADGAVSSTSYATPRIERACDPRSNTGEKQGACVATRVDGLERVVETVRWLAGSFLADRVESRTYDAGGRLTRIRQNNDPATDVHFFYDALDRQVAINHPDQVSIRWTLHDENDNLITEASSRGSISRQYDALDRLQGWELSEGGEVTQQAMYVYDTAEGYGTGRLHNAMLYRGIESVAAYRSVEEYDARGNPLSEGERIFAGSQSPAYITENNYDEIGRLVSTTLPHPEGGSEELIYTYGPTGQLQSVGSSLGDAYVQTLEYDMFGRSAQTTYGNGATDVWTYRGAWGYGEPGGAHKLTRVSTWGPTGALHRQLSYESYNPNGHLVRVDDLTDGAPFADTQEQHAVYDNASRLTGWFQRPGQPLLTFGHDAFGNLTRLGLHHYEYSGFGPHQPSKAVDDIFGAQYPIAYDDHGNMTQLPFGRTLRYDPLDRLIEVRNDSGLLATYAYDDNGRRVLSDTGGELTFYFKDFDLTGNKLVRHIEAGDRVVASSTVDSFGSDLLYGSASAGGIEADIRYYHPDRLGHVQLATDGFGNAVENTVYRPYGQTASYRADGTSQASNNQFAFTGHRAIDASGLIYMNARYYDPWLGMFTSHDPASQFMSPYSYGDGNPLNGSDPTGEVFGVDATPVMVQGRVVTVVVTPERAAFEAGAGDMARVNGELMDSCGCRTNEEIQADMDGVLDNGMLLAKGLSILVPGGGVVMSGLEAAQGGIEGDSTKAALGTRSAVTEAAKEAVSDPKLKTAIGVINKLTDAISQLGIEGPATTEQAPTSFFDLF